MSLCMLSVLAGSTFALWAPAVQFALGLLVITTAGSTLALMRGAASVQVLLWSLAVFVCVQVGYGLGAVAIAVYRTRRERAPEGGRRAPLPSPVHKASLK